MNSTKKVLVVDDEIKIIEVLKSFLESKDFMVFTSEDGKCALEIFEKENISIVLLDLMLPDMTGEEVCKAMRKKSRIPIIMLTAKVDEKDLLTGFNIGADDYITKPFSLMELYARMEAVLRRSSVDVMPLFQKNYWNDHDLEIDFESHTVKKNKHIVNLTSSEYKILVALIKYPNKVFTREELIETALGSEYDGYDRTIDFHIKNIRQKIETDPKNPVYIITIHGVGYRFGAE